MHLNEYLDKSSVKQVTIFLHRDAARPTELKQDVKNIRHGQALRFTYIFDHT